MANVRRFWCNRTSVSKLYKVLGIKHLSRLLILLFYFGLKRKGTEHGKPVVIFAFIKEAETGYGYREI